MPWDELKPRKFAAFDSELDGISRYFGHLGGDGGEPNGRFAELIDSADASGAREPAVAGR